MENAAALAILSASAIVAMLTAVAVLSMTLTLSLGWACISGLLRWASRGAGLASR